MMEFTEPMMLAVAAGAGGIGGVLVWRSNRVARRVSSVRLWEGLTAGEIRKGRAVRWELLYFVLAAILAGLAMAEPRWSFTAVEQTPVPKVEWAMRSVAGKAKSSELFVHIADTAGLPPQLTVEYFGNQDPDRLPEGVKLTTTGESLDTADAKLGAIVHPSVDATDQHFWARLWAGRQVISTVGFTPEVSGGIRVLTSGTGDAALTKLLKIFPRGEGEVVLADAGEVDVKQIEDGGVVLALPGAKVDGVGVRGEKTVPGGVGMVGVNVPAFVKLEGGGGVRVEHYIDATLSPEWGVLATVNGSPVLAERKFERGVKVLWIGLYPAQTAWAADESFVLFFSDYVAKSFPVGSGKGVVEWKAEVKTPEETPQNPVQLSGSFGIAAIALLMAGVGGLVWRERR